MSILIVDWLGRGGIAQTSAAWALELAAYGRSVKVVSRTGLELGSGGGISVDGIHPRKHALTTHCLLTRAAARIIENERPEIVVIQNYLIPALERDVFRAAHKVGATIIFVIHDHRLHSVAAGTSVGLRGALLSSDVVVCHSKFVASGVRRVADIPVELLPHPIILETLSHPLEAAPTKLAGEGLLALHFGVVRRRYKGLDTVLRVASGSPAGWRVAVMGAGAPEGCSDAITIPGFVSPGCLIASIRQSAATLLPYRYATQSGAVALAQVLGSVPVVCGVGGIPEQVIDGHTGILVPPEADVSSWTGALIQLSDGEMRARMVTASLAHRLGEHRDFADRLRLLTGTKATENEISVRMRDVSQVVTEARTGTASPPW